MKCFIYKEKAQEKSKRTVRRNASNVIKSITHFSFLMDDDFTLQIDEPFTCSDLQIFPKGEQGVMTDLPETNDPAKPETTDQVPKSSPDVHPPKLQVPEPPMPSDIAAIRISDLIPPPDDPSEMAEPKLPPPPLASAPMPSQNKSTKPNKKVCTHSPRQPKLKLSKNTSTGHLVGHGAAEPFNCSVKNCDYQTKWQNLLYSHMRVAHATRYFQTGSKRKPRYPEPSVKCSKRNPRKIRRPYPLASPTDS